MRFEFRDEARDGEGVFDELEKNWDEREMGTVPIYQFTRDRKSTRLNSSHRL